MVLLNEAWMWAMPSATFFNLFANFGSSLCHVLSLLLLASNGLARTLASTSIGPGALTTAGQALAMAQTTVATEVHQTLDVHCDFAAQITFNSEFADFVTQTIHVRIGQVFHFCRTNDAGRITDFLCAGTADAEDRSQSDFCMLMVRNVLPLQYGPLNHSNISKINECQTHQEINPGAAYDADPCK